MGGGGRGLPVCRGGSPLSGAACGGFYWPKVNIMGGGWTAWLIHVGVRKGVWVCVGKDDLWAGEWAVNESSGENGRTGG